MTTTTQKRRVNTLAAECISWGRRFFPPDRGTRNGPLPFDPKPVPSRIKLTISWCGKLGVSKGKPKVSQG